MCLSTAASSYPGPGAGSFTSQVWARCSLSDSELVCWLDWPFLAAFCSQHKDFHTQHILIECPGRRKGARWPGVEDVSLNRSVGWGGGNNLISNLVTGRWYSLNRMIEPRRLHACSKVILFQLSRLTSHRLLSVSLMDWAFFVKQIFY